MKKTRNSILGAPYIPSPDIEIKPNIPYESFPTEKQNEQMELLKKVYVASFTWKSKDKTDKISTSYQRLSTFRDSSLRKNIQVNTQSRLLSEWMLFWDGQERVIDDTCDELEDIKTVDNLFAKSNKYFLNIANTNRIINALFPHILPCPLDKEENFGMYCLGVTEVEDQYLGTIAHNYFTSEPHIETYLYIMKNHIFQMCNRILFAFDFMMNYDWNNNHLKPGKIEKDQGSDTTRPLHTLTLGYRTKGKIIKKVDKDFHLSPSDKGARLTSDICINMMESARLFSIDDLVWFVQTIWEKLPPENKDNLAKLRFEVASKYTPSILDKRFNDYLIGTMNLFKDMMKKPDTMEKIKNSLSGTSPQEKLFSKQAKLAKKLGIEY